MKKIIGIIAAVLTVGFIGVGTASAHFGPFYGNGHRTAYAGPGYMHRVSHAVKRGYGRGPAFCFTVNGQHWRAESHHMRGDGPMHRGYRW